MTREIDMIAARELALYAANSFEVYRMIYQPVIKNLDRKVKKGIFDSEKAEKSFLRIADYAAKLYHSEFGNRLVPWYQLFNKATRLECARMLLSDYIFDTEDEL